MMDDLPLALRSGAEDVLNNTGATPDIIPAADREMGLIMLGRMLWRVMVFGYSDLPHNGISLKTHRWLCDHGSAPGLSYDKEGMAVPVFALIDLDVAHRTLGAMLLPKVR